MCVSLEFNFLCNETLVAIMCYLKCNLPSVSPLVVSLGDRSVGVSICPKKGEKLHFHAPIGALVRK